MGLDDILDEFKGGERCQNCYHSRSIVITADPLLSQQIYCSHNRSTAITADLLQSRTHQINWCHS